MIYLENFRFPTFEKEDRFLAVFYSSPRLWQEPYPFKILSRHNLHTLDFTEVTILYGGNGSGKSTALNIIGNKLEISRQSAYNKGDLQKEYLRLCSYRAGSWDHELFELKKSSYMITSDDIFKFMLDARVKNDLFNVRSAATAKEMARIKCRRYTANERDAMRHLDFETGENVDTFSRIVDMKQKDTRQYIRDEMGRKTQTYSNGETGFMRFVDSIQPDSLYLLDEPENSLSCELQMKLAEYIEQCAKHCGCQFIIATHSPFLLALQEAKIYNLDADPATVAKWWELPNMQLYHKLFKEYDQQLAEASRKSTPDVSLFE